MPKLDEQISTLQERLKQLKLRQQHSDARKRALEIQRERKAETRRKFLVGSVILDKVREGSLPENEFKAWLDQSLERSEDRALFALPPKSGHGEANRGASDDGGQDGSGTAGEA
jgi:hypothetical protein